MVAEQRDKASGSTATRMITRNIELSREDRAAARALANEKREALRAAKERAAEEQRRKQESLDSVWLE